MLAGACYRRDALHEIEHALRWASLLFDDGRDDPRGFWFTETFVAQKRGPIFVGSGYDMVARRHDPLDEGHRA